MYPDVATIGTACGGAILVIQAESTRSEVAEEAKEILEGTGADDAGRCAQSAALSHSPVHLQETVNGTQECDCSF